MSTTLIPPTHYVVRRSGGPLQLCTTLHDAAEAVIRSGPITPRVFAVTGVRQRNLSPYERNALASEVRQLRPPMSPAFAARRRQWA